MSTTLLNAYLEPVLVRYIDHLNHGLDDAKVGTQQRFLMQSNGGVMPFTAAIGGGRTVHTLFSGPAAGAQASAYLARDEAQSGLVTLDMGGTSADIAFIEGGVPLETTESMIARRQIDVPALDMSSISAGGGSIAWIDGGGFLNVGPQSAGADPGPACYGRGGTRPTVTDADVVCGYLNPGLLPRRRADARRRRVAQGAAGARRRARSRWTCSKPPSASSASSTCAWPTRCGCSPPSAASISRPSRCCRSAAPAPCMPPRSRKNSACGASWCRRGRARSRRSGCSAPTWCTTTSAPELKPLADVTPEHAEDIFRQLEAKAREELKAEGMDPAAAAFLRELDLRYTGQGYELRTSLDGLFTDRLTAASLAAARERFDERHAQIHGHAAKERPVEVVSYRLRVRVDVPKYQPRQEARRRRSRRSPPRARARSISAASPRSRRRSTSATSSTSARMVTGPAIVEQFDATTVIPAGWTGRVDGYRNLILERGG